MWGRIIGKSQEKSENAPSSASQRKEDGRRRRPESTVSSTSARKPPRDSDRDRDSKPNTTSSAYTSRTLYPESASTSVPSSYATASSKQIHDQFTSSSLIRDSRLSKGIKKTNTGREKQDRDDDRVSKSGRRRERSTSGDRKSDKKRRSKSLDRSNGHRDRRERHEMERVEDRETFRGLNGAKSVHNDERERTRAGSTSLNESGSFSAQIGGSSFTQFPGQYDGGMFGFPTAPVHPPAGLSSHVPAQFPGQFPIESAAPYRPPLAVSEGGVGLAADYYGDTGESVAHQPGVRPQPPSLIVGAEPHLQSALAIAAPPPEPSATGSIGAAASFFAASDDFQSSHSGIPPKVTSQEYPSNSSQHSNPTGPVLLAGGAALHQTVESFGQSGNTQISTSSSNISSHQTSALPSTSLYPLSSVSPSNGYHSSAPLISTLGSAAAGAAAGYMIGSHSSAHTENFTKPQVVNDLHSGRPSTQSQRPFIHTEASGSAFGINNHKPLSGHKPGRSSNKPSYAAEVVGGVGLSAAAYHNTHHDSAQQSYSMESRYSPMIQRHRHHGPLDKLVDFWRDLDGVAQYEDYTESIGVCKYCFAPGSSSRDAPRKHYYHRRGSNERYGSSIRVDKESRYWSSDSESRRKGNKSWFATGLAGYGLGKIGKNLFAVNHDFEDTNDVQSENVNQSKISLYDRPHDLSLDRKSRVSQARVKGSSNIGSSYRNRSQDHIETGITSDEKIYPKSSNSVSFSGPITTYDGRHRSRSKSRDRERDFAEIAVGTALGSSLLASGVRKNSPSSKKTKAESNYRSQEYDPEPDIIFGVNNLRNRHNHSSLRHSPSASYGDVRRSRSRTEPGTSGNLFNSLSENRHNEHQRKRKTNFLNLENSSSSSVDYDLAFGVKTDNSRAKKQTIGPKSFKKTNASLLGLGTAAAMLAADEARKGEKSKRRADIVAVKEIKGNRGRASEPYDNGTIATPYPNSEDNLWESASDDDDTSSVDSTLAYGGLHRRSQESLRSDSSGTSKWNWRWGSKKERKKAPLPKSHVFDVVGVATGLDSAGTVAGLTSHKHQQKSAMSKNGSPPPLQHVYPISTSDPARFEAIRQSLAGSTGQPLITSRPGVIPLQQPQPIAQVPHSVYVTQAPLAHSYSAPIGPPVFSRMPRPHAEIIPVTQPLRSESSVSANMPGSFPSKEFPKYITRGNTEAERPSERRDSSPIPSLTIMEQRRNTSICDDTPIVKFDLASERPKKERKNRQDKKMQKEDNLKKVQGQEEERQIHIENERISKQRQNREQEDILKAARRREAEDQVQNKDDRSTKETLIRVAEDEWRRKESEKRELEIMREHELTSEREKASSWGVPILASLAGAAVWTNIVDEPSLDAEAHRQKHQGERNKSPEYQTALKLEESNTSSTDNSKQAVRAERQMRIAKQAAARVRNTPSPVYESYAAYFTPSELLSKSQNERQKIGPNSDNEISSNYAPHVITIKPSGSRAGNSSASYSFPQLRDQNEPDHIARRWHVPILNLIKPTPPQSIDGSAEGDSSPIIPARDTGDTGVQESSEPRTTIEAAIGEPEICEVDIVNPTNLHEEPTEWSIVEQDADPKQSCVKSEIKTSTHEDVSPVTVTHVDRMPGEFVDDLDFAATVAAGLEDTGFDPSIVIDDPSFRRRDSPPGSEEPEFYRSPFFEIITDSAQEPLITTDAQPQSGFIVGELPPTPTDVPNPKVNYDPITDASLESTDAGKQRTYQTTHRRKSDEATHVVSSVLQAPIRAQIENFVEPDFIAIDPSSVTGGASGSSKAKKSKSKKLKRQDASSEGLETNSTARNERSRDEYFDASETPGTRSKVTNESFDDTAVLVPLPDDPSDEIQSQAETRDSPKVDKSSDGHNLYESPSEDANSIAASALVLGELDESRKSKKKSKRRTSDYDDIRSSVSSPASLGDKKDTKSKSQKEKKGSLFGLFSKSIEYVSQKPLVNGEEEDNKQEGKGKGKKSKSRRSVRDENDIHVEDVRASKSMIDLSRTDNMEANDKSRKSRDKEERSLSRRDDKMSRDSGRITQDLPAKVHMPASYGRPHNVLPIPLLTPPENRDDDYPRTESSLSKNDIISGLERLLVDDPDKTPSLLDKHQKDERPPDQISILKPNEDLMLEKPTSESANSEQRNILEESLPPLPDSWPTTPASVGGSEEFSTLPINKPLSPQAIPIGQRRRSSMLQLSDVSHPSLSSSTAIPLFVRRPMSAGFSHSSPSTPAASTQTAEIFTPKSKQVRPLSSDFKFKSSTEFRPPWLVERHSSRQESARDEVLPSLPSSHSTSRASSIHDLNDQHIIQAFEPNSVDLSEEVIESSFLATDVQQHASPDILKAQQATPTAATFQHNEGGYMDTEKSGAFHMKNSFQCRDAGDDLDALRIDNQPGRSTQSVEDLFLDYRSKSPSRYDLEHYDLPSLPVSRASSPYDKDDGSNPSLTATNGAIEQPAISIVPLSAHCPNPDQGQVVSTVDSTQESNLTFMSFQEDDDSSEVRMQDIGEPDVVMGLKTKRKKNKKQAKQSRAFDEAKMMSSEASPLPAAIDSAIKPLSFEEQRRNEEQDAQDAVDSWFTSEPSKKGKKGKKEKQKSITPDTINMIKSPSVPSDINIESDFGPRFASIESNIKMNHQASEALQPGSVALTESKELDKHVFLEAENESSRSRYLSRDIVGIEASPLENDVLQASDVDVPPKLASDTMVELDDRQRLIAKSKKTKRQRGKNKGMGTLPSRSTDLVSENIVTQQNLNEQRSIDTNKEHDFILEAPLVDSALPKSVEAGNDDSIKHSSVIPDTRELDTPESNFNQRLQTEDLTSFSPRDLTSTTIDQGASESLISIGQFDKNYEIPETIQMDEPQGTYLANKEEIHEQGLSDDGLSRMSSYLSVPSKGAGLHASYQELGIQQGLSQVEALESKECQKLPLSPEHIALPIDDDWDLVDSPQHLWIEQNLQEVNSPKKIQPYNLSNSPEQIALPFDDDLDLADSPRELWVDQSLPEIESLEKTKADNLSSPPEQITLPFDDDLDLLDPLPQISLEEQDLLSKIESPTEIHPGNPSSLHELVVLPDQDSLYLHISPPQNPPVEQDLTRDESSIETVPHSLSNLPEQTVLSVDNSLEPHTSILNPSPLEEEDLSIPETLRTIPSSMPCLPERDAVPVDNDANLVDSRRQSHHSERPSPDLQGSQNTATADMLIEPEGIPLPLDNDLDLLNEPSEDLNTGSRDQSIQDSPYQDELPTAVDIFTLNSLRKEHVMSHQLSMPLSMDSNHDLIDKPREDMESMSTVLSFTGAPLENSQTSHMTPSSTLDVPLESSVQASETDYSVTPASKKSKKGRKGRHSQQRIPFTDAGQESFAQTPVAEFTMPVAQVPETGMNVDTSNDFQLRQPPEEERMQHSKKRGKKSKIQKHEYQDNNPPFSEESRVASLLQSTDDGTSMKAMENPSEQPFSLMESSHGSNEHHTSVSDIKFSPPSCEPPISKDEASTLCRDEDENPELIEVSQSMTNKKSLEGEPAEDDEWDFPTKRKAKKGKKSLGNKQIPVFPDSEKTPKLKLFSNDGSSLADKSIEQDMISITSAGLPQEQMEDRSGELTADAESEIGRKKKGKKGKKSKVEQSELLIEKGNTGQENSNNQEPFAPKATIDEVDADLTNEGNPQIKNITTADILLEDENFSEFPLGRKSKKWKKSNNRSPVVIAKPSASGATKIALPESASLDHIEPAIENSEKFSNAHIRKGKKHKPNVPSSPVSKVLEGSQPLNEAQLHKQLLETGDLPGIPQTEEYFQREEEPSIKEPTIEEPAIKEPAIEEPAIKRPIVKEPVIEESIIEELVVGKSMMKEPTIEEPIIEEPIIEEPLIKESPVEESPVEESPVEESPVEESPVEEPLAKELAVEKPSFKEPAIEEPTLGSTLSPNILEPTIEESVIRAQPPKEPLLEKPTSREHTSKEIISEEPTLGKASLDGSIIEGPRSNDYNKEIPILQESQRKDYIPESYQSIRLDINKAIGLSHNEEDVSKNELLSNAVLAPDYDSFSLGEPPGLRHQDRKSERPSSTSIYDSQYVAQRFLDDKSDVSEAYAPENSTLTDPGDPRDLCENIQKDERFDEKSHDMITHEQLEPASQSREEDGLSKDLTSVDDKYIASVPFRPEDQGTMLPTQSEDFHRSSQHHKYPKTKGSQESIASTNPIDARDDIPRLSSEPLKIPMRGHDRESLPFEEIQESAKTPPLRFLENEILDEAKALVLPEDNADDFADGSYVQPETHDEDQQDHFDNIISKHGEKGSKETINHTPPGWYGEAVLAEHGNVNMEELEARSDVLPNKPPHSFQDISPVRLGEPAALEVPEQPLAPEVLEEHTTYTVPEELAASKVPESFMIPEIPGQSIELRMLEEAMVSEAPEQLAMSDRPAESMVLHITNTPTISKTLEEHLVPQTPKPSILEEPTIPEASQESTMSEVQKVIRVPSTPDVPENYVIPEISQELISPEVTEAPMTTAGYEVPEELEVSEKPEESMIPEIPEEPTMPDTVKELAVVETPEVTEVPEEFTNPEIPEEPTALKAFEDNTTTSEPPKASTEFEMLETTITPELPKELAVPEVSKPSNDFALPHKPTASEEVENIHILEAPEESVMPKMPRESTLNQMLEDPTRSEAPGEPRAAEVSEEPPTRKVPLDPTTFEQLRALVEPEGSVERTEPPRSPELMPTHTEPTGLSSKLPKGKKNKKVKKAQASGWDETPETVAPQEPSTEIVEYPIIGMSRDLEDSVDNSQAQENRVADLGDGNISSQKRNKKDKRKGKKAQVLDYNVKPDPPSTKDSQPDVDNVKDTNELANEDLGVVQPPFTDPKDLALTETEPLQDGSTEIDTFSIKKGRKDKKKSKKGQISDQFHTPETSTAKDVPPNQEVTEGVDELMDKGHKDFDSIIEQTEDITAIKAENEDVWPAEGEVLSVKKGKKNKKSRNAQDSSWEKVSEAPREKTVTLHTSDPEALDKSIQDESTFDLKHPPKAEAEPLITDTKKAKKGKKKSKKAQPFDWNETAEDPFVDTINQPISEEVKTFKPKVVSAADPALVESKPPEMSTSVVVEDGRENTLSGDTQALPLESTDNLREQLFFQEKAGIVESMLDDQSLDSVQPHDSEVIQTIEEPTETRDSTARKKGKKVKKSKKQDWEQDDGFSTFDDIPRNDPGSQNLDETPPTVQGGASAKDIGRSSTSSPLPIHEASITSKEVPEPIISTENESTHIPDDLPEMTTAAVVAGSGIVISESLRDEPRPDQNIGEEKSKSEERTRSDSNEIVNVDPFSVRIETPQSRTIEGSNTQNQGDERNLKISDKPSSGLYEEPVSLQTWSTEYDNSVYRDSGVHVTDSPVFPGSSLDHENVRDSGYQGIEEIPAVSIDLENLGEETKSLDDFHQHNADHKSSQTPIKEKDDIEDADRDDMAGTSINPLNISIEVDPAYYVSISQPEQAHTHAQMVKQDDQDAGSKHEDGIKYQVASPIPLHEETRQLSPTTLISKDRSSTLSQQASSTIGDNDIHELKDKSTMAYQVHPMDESLATEKDIHNPPRSQGTTVLQTSLEDSRGNLEPIQSGSLFGGPIGINSDVPEIVPSPNTPSDTGSSQKRKLKTINEYSPEESPLHKKSRDISDVGLPEHGLKAARRSATPQSFSQHRVHSPLFKETGNEDMVSTDDILSRLSWPPVDEENHAVDLDRNLSRGMNSERHPSIASALTADLHKPHEADKRSVSGASIRSGESIHAIIRTPDHVRSASSLSNRSSGTPPLRRVDRSVSSDLRGASKRSEVAQLANHAEAEREKEAEAKAKAEAETEVVIPSSSTYDPVRDKGKNKSRIQVMTDVYEGWGDVRGSPRSPTRPPSVRRRQSMQILDLETRLDQLVSENRLLLDAKSKAERSLNDAAHDRASETDALNDAVQSRDLYLSQKDSELNELREILDGLQQEVSNLTEVNEGLMGAREEFAAEHQQRYSQLESEHANTYQQWQESQRELDEVKQKHSQLSTGMEGIVRHEINAAVEKKNAEIRELRDELLDAREQVRILQKQILAAKPSNDLLTSRDEDYFDSQCQQLCQHVQQWVLRFSKFSDMRACRHLRDVADEKIADRFDNAILDGSDVNIYLADRVKRRDVFMSVVMNMIWEYVFTRYLFGMDREQRQKLKSLEKTLTEVGPPNAVNKWRATTLTMLSKREAFNAQRAQDAEAIVQEIYATLAVFLPPPSHLQNQIQESLRNVMRAAVDLSVEMRTQKAEYIMLPPIQPEFDINGDLANKVYFNSEVMNERSGDTISNEDLAARKAVVRMVLFPLVVKKGDDRGIGDEQIVVCPAQVLVAKEDESRTGGKKGVRVLSAAGDRMEGLSVGNRSVQSFAPSNMDEGMGGMI